MRFRLVVLMIGLAGGAAAQPLTPGYRRPTLPPPRMACIVQPSPGFGGTVCPTQQGARGSLCRCGDLPNVGQRDFVRF
jgi:hypothetical protein